MSKDLFYEFKLSTLHEEKQLFKIADTRKFQSLTIEAKGEQNKDMCKGSCSIFKEKRTYFSRLQLIFCFTFPENVSQTDFWKFHSEILINEK